MQTTNDVLDHYLKCFGQGDVDGILSDIASAAILFTPAGPLKGAGEIGPFFHALLAEFGKPGTTHKMLHRSVEGEYAFSVDCGDRR
jgi:hypothetical protein